jgi:hypothetical protein
MKEGGFQENSRVQLFHRQHYRRLLKPILPMLLD